MSKERDVFSEGNEVKANWIKWGKVGDKIQGTLISVREIPSKLPPKTPLKAGEVNMVKLYEILATAGEFHNIEKKKVSETPTIINEGEVWLVGGGVGIDASLRNVKIGQILGIKFTEEKASKDPMMNDTKVKKVYTEGKMNEAWLAEQEVGKNF